MTALLLLPSLALQLAAAIIALGAPRSRRTRTGWWVFASALSLMAARRVISLIDVLSGSSTPTLPMEELLALAISVLMLAGVVLLRQLDREFEEALAESTARERERRESEELWERVFEFAPDGYILLDLNGKLERMNMAACEIAGVTREHSEGKHIFELGILDEQGMEQAARNLGMMQQGGDPGAAEYTFRRSDGTERDVEIIGYMIEVRGRPTMLTIVHDITRRRGIEQELRRSRLRLEEAQRVAGIVTFEIDLRSATMWVSNDPRTGVVSETGRTEMSLEEGFAYIVPEDRELVANSMAAGAMQGGAGDIVTEYRQQDVVLGREAIVRSTARADLDEDGNVVRLIGATVDLTDIRKAEQEIRTLNTALEERVRARTAELERAVDELEAFSYSVSHDLRSPLRAMAGYSDMVLEADGDKLSMPSRDHLERVRASSVRMAGLIDGLLSLSRLARARRNDSPVDLSDIARSVIGELRQADPDREVDVMVQEGLHTVADAGMMSLVLQNLLSNAWKFTRSTPRARISFGRDGRGAYFVRDNGVGFDPAQSAKLFRPFERLHRTDEFEGTGIGLATVGRIVRHHGGRAWAEGSIGKGSTFWFTIGDRDGREEAGSSMAG